MSARPAVCFVLLLGLWAGSAAAGEVELVDAWIRLPPPGTHAAGYGTLRNRGTSPRRVLAVRSSAAEQVELHRTVVEDGVARMAPVGVLVLPAEGEVTFAPRGLHLMLMRPRPLHEGDPVTLTFELDGGETLSGTAVVRRQAEPAADHSHH